MCSSKRARRKAEPDEIILDEADGLDWPSICKCDLIHSVYPATTSNSPGERSLSLEGHPLSAH
jgi:hypothetical protein